jgi:hypothetical protein
MDLVLIFPYLVIGLPVVLLVAFAIAMLWVVWLNWTLKRPILKLTEHSSPEVLRQWYLRCLAKDQADLAELVYRYMDKTDEAFAAAHKKWVASKEPVAFGSHTGFYSWDVDDAKKTLRGLLQTKAAP